MTLIGTGLVLLLALAVSYIFLRTRAGRMPRAATIATYAEVKRRIRAGDAEGPVVQPPEPIPALPLVDTLKLQDSNRFVSAIFERVSQKAGRGDSALNPSESAVIHIFGLEAEVNNGGFDQYFFNSAGDGAAEALAALELIGAAKAADITRRAIAVFGARGPARDREARWLQMDRLDAPAKATLDELSDEFQNYPDPLADLVMKHCRAEIARFT